jgi:hypothetical protein
MFLPSLGPGPDQFGGAAFAPPILALPTPDLQGVTPQILASYFQPVQLGTNAALLNGLFRVSFVPPLAPDTSSHAQYIIK